MRYEIRKYEGDEADYDAEFWPGSSIDELRAYALRIMEEGPYDRVKVYDGTGSLVMAVARTPDWV